MTAIICPMCKRDADTHRDPRGWWVTICLCTRGRSRISATHSVERWEANARKRYAKQAEAYCAAKLRAEREVVPCGPLRR